jgi:hypothetical protein
MLAFSRYEKIRTGVVMSLTSIENGGRIVPSFLLDELCNMSQAERFFFYFAALTIEKKKTQENR